MQPIVLASSSIYRRQLMQRLGLQFDTSSPDIDESQKNGESTRDMVSRLSIEKARAVARSHPDALIVGSDQAVEFNGLALGKPGSRQRAIQQLLDASGKAIDFHTAVCLLSPRQTEHGLHLDRTRVHFRKLSLAEIERYIDAESPLDCAGSFKSEGLGITLFDRIENDDPSALIGLPLIGLSELLRQAGVNLP